MIFPIRCPRWSPEVPTTSPGPVFRPESISDGPGARRGPPEAEDADDEEQVKDTLQQYSQVTFASEKTRQKHKRSEKPPPLTAAQIKAIAAKARSGENKLPELVRPSDSTCHAVWFLMDSGNPVNAVDFEKSLPGVTAITGQTQ